jgi:Ca-activated chloride channel family protein
VLTAQKAAQRIALPLQKVNIQAKVLGQVAEVTITQTFRNLHQEALEAVYIFPLSGGSAVSSFEMKVGDRVLRGQVEERTQARQHYQNALQEGKRAALLEQERDDVFTVQVGNIPPDEEIEIKITYSERLAFFENGATEIHLPMVVAPRYVPGNPLDSCDVGDGIEEDTDIVPDASRISPPRLAKGFDPKVGLNIEVELLSDMPIHELACSQHATRTSNSENGRISVSLARTDELLNRDFVLRWRVVENKIQSAFHAFKSQDGTYFGMLSIVPPNVDQHTGDRDVLFILDRSGSMRGVKMASASKACSILLSTLGPADRFAISCFNTRVDWFYPNGSNGDRFLIADESGLKRGEDFLRGITSEGGTELDQALESGLYAMNHRNDASKRIPVVVLLTDGQISDESRVLARIQKEIGKSRIFTVGIDTAVNQGFLSRLASLGKGISTFVEPGVALEQALRSISREIGSPIIVDLKVEDIDAGLLTESFAPSRIPDLFAGRASVTFFQMKHAGPIRIQGKFTNGGKFEKVVKPDQIILPAIAHLWARARVRDLEDQFRIDQDIQEQTKKRIIEIAIRHTLLTRFTAFVVVDETEVVNQDGSLRKIVQPVEMPAQWEMEMDPGMITGAFKLSTMAFPAAPMPARADAPSSPMMQIADRQGGPVSIVKDFFRKRRAEVPAKKMSVNMKQLKHAVKEFMDAFVAFMKSIRKGNLPSVKILERTRKELDGLIAQSSEYPAVQNLLNGVIAELLSLMNTPGIDATTLQNVLDKNQRAIQDAFREVDGGSGAAPFWESTI